ncbi:hypothetical protein FQR65_LT08127 [Abscondita terminalis]|nr:hypothetical protein FQR65_LT08127 [Abscondita terminalis]
MGHGKADRDVDEVIAHNNVCVPTKQIEDQFDNRNCKVLRNKPKIFMYQICRGETPDYGTWHDNIETDSGIVRQAKVMLMRSCSDMLIAHSTTPGSWYMSLFCRVMMTHAHDTHLEDIFKIIDNKLSGLRSGRRTMQTSMYYNIGFKKCYIHPGIYLEGNEIKCIHDDVPPQNQSTDIDIQ